MRQGIVNHLFGSGMFAGRRNYSLTFGKLFQWMDLTPLTNSSLRSSAD